MLFIRQPWDELNDRQPANAGRQPALSVWHGSANPTEIAGIRNITMVYTGHAHARPARGIGGTIIDPTLPVDNNNWRVWKQAQYYYPNYEALDPSARRAYLEWLADGKRDTSYSISYMFLYFYGLEKRYFQDNPPHAERGEIRTEVKRLLQINGHHRAARSYLRLFIEAAEVQDMEENPPEDADECPPKGISLSLLTRIGRKAGNREPLTADDLLQWYTSDPAYGLTQGDARIYQAYRRMFTVKFNGRYPGGMTVGTPQKTLSANYTAASGSFVVNLLQGDRQVYDPRTLLKPLQRAKEIADETRAALTDYRKAMTQVKKGMPVPARALLLLPQEIADCGQPPDLRDFLAWLQERDETGTPPTVEETAERLSGRHRNPVNEMFTVRKALETAGQSWAPDPLISGYKPKLKETGATAPIPAVPARDKDTITAARRAAAALTAAAHAGLATEQEATIRAMKHAGTPDSAQGSLEAHRRYVNANRPDAGALRQTRQALGENSQQVLTFTAEEAARSMPLTTKTEKAIAAVYTTFGGDPETIHSDIHHAASGGIPKSRSASGEKLELDPERIARTTEETKDTATLLANIFQADDEPDNQAENAPQSPDQNRLDEAHYQLLLWLSDQGTITQKDLESRSNDLGLMAGGAAETLNELALQIHGDLIMEETQDGWEINPEAAASMLNME